MCLNIDQYRAAVGLSMLGHVFRAGVCRPCDTIELTATIVHFKRLGSRHIHKEIEIPYCVFRGPFHKSSYERFLLYKFVEPVLNYRSNEFVALTNLCETVPRFNEIICKTGLKHISRHLHTSATSSRKNTLKQYEVILCIFVVYTISQNACIERG